METDNGSTGCALVSLVCLQNPFFNMWPGPLWDEWHDARLFWTVAKVNGFGSLFLRILG
jgi:hypothetical protein